MTPTIQCFDDQSMQMTPASVLCNNFLSQENYPQISASDRITSSRDVRTNHQWTNYLRNRHPRCNNKRNIYPCVSGLKADIKKSFDSSSDDDKSISEEHLNVIRKRQALLLVTIQTMALFRHNQILEHKLSALHKRVVQIQKERKVNDGESRSE